jgi:hypothetical protein
VKKFLVIGCVGLLALCLIVGGLAFALGFGLTQGVATVGDDFMAALRDGNYAKAYGLCDPALQTKLGGESQLKAMIENNNVKPTAWNFSSRNINNADGLIEGSVTMAGNRQGSLRLELIKSGNDWKIIGFNFKEN